MDRFKITVYDSKSKVGGFATHSTKDRTFNHLVESCPWRDDATMIRKLVKLYTKISCESHLPRRAFEDGITLVIEDFNS